MRFKLGLKIVFIVLILAIIVLIGIGMYGVIMSENTQMEWSMGIPFVIMILGFLGVVYQIKTIKFYQNLDVKPKVKGVLFWLGNLLFSLALFCSSLYVLYTFYIMYFDSIGIFRANILVPLVVFSLGLILAIGLAIEQSLLYKAIVNYEERSLGDSIDDIKGHQEDDDLL